MTSSMAHKENYLVRRVYHVKLTQPSLEKE